MHACVGKFAENVFELLGVMHVSLLFNKKSLGKADILRDSIMRQDRQGRKRPGSFLLSTFVPNNTSLWGDFSLHAKSEHNTQLPSANYFAQ